MNMIDQVVLTPCRRLDTSRGFLQEILRNDGEPGFALGQVYVTCTHQGIIKAWYRHAIQFDSFFVLQGAMRLVLLDDRRESPSFGQINHFEMTADTPQLLRLPPGIWHGFQSLAGELRLLHMNSQPFQFDQPDEVRRAVEDPGMPQCWVRG